MDTLQKLFQDYIAYAGKLREETASIKAVLGFREREIYDSGHKDFDKAVEAWVEAFRRENPSQPELVQALDILLFSAVGYEGKAPFGYLCAVQRHALKLIPLLDEAGRTTVLARFEAQYPSGRRLPIQKDIDKLLKQGSAPKKKGFLSFR
ncbi:MAG: hypothetical protein ACI4PH_05980 [Faecousia sp.]